MTAVLRLRCRSVELRLVFWIGAREISVRVRKRPKPYLALGKPKLTPSDGLIEALGVLTPYPGRVLIGTRRLLATTTTHLPGQSLKGRSKPAKNRHKEAGQVRRAKGYGV